MTKVCKQCLQEKEIINFEPRGAFFRGICRVCVNQNMKIKISETRKYLDSQKRECFVCGYSRYLGALDFHHLVPSEKDFNIGTFAGQRAFSEHTKKLIDEEIEKCILLCSNCHREFHAGVIEINI